jgi:hypothetical protein
MGIHGVGTDSLSPDDAVPASQPPETVQVEDFQTESFSQRPCQSGFSGTDAADKSDPLCGREAGSLIAPHLDSFAELGVADPEIAG